MSALSSAYDDIVCGIALWHRYASPRHCGLLHESPCGSCRYLVVRLGVKVEDTASHNEIAAHGHRAAHSVLLVSCRQHFKSWVAESVVGKYGERHGESYAVVSAERCPVGVHPALSVAVGLYDLFYGVGQCIEPAPLFCHADHVTMVQYDDRLMVLIAGCRRFLYHSAVLPVASPCEAMALCEVAEIVCNALLMV